MKPAAKILQKVRRGVQTVAYGNPIYRKILTSGEAPGRLHFTLPDLWPGDAQAGLALIGSQRSLFDRPSLPHPGTAMRNLRAVGTDAARQAGESGEAGRDQNARGREGDPARDARVL